MTRCDVLWPAVTTCDAQGELQLPVCMEDELGRELPRSALLYRPARERVCAVLFSLYHRSFLHSRDRERPADELHEVPTVQVRWRHGGPRRPVPPVPGLGVPHSARAGGAARSRTVPPVGQDRHVVWSGMAVLVYVL